MFYNAYEHYPYFQYTYSCYPTRDQQLNFIRAYINELKSIKDKKVEVLPKVLANSLRRSQEAIDDLDDLEDNEPTAAASESTKADLDEEKLLKEANYFALASHLFWALWAICQAASTKITFDYLVSGEPVPVHLLFLTTQTRFFSRNTLWRDAMLISSKRSFCFQTVSTRAEAPFQKCSLSL